LFLFLFFLFFFFFFSSTLETGPRRPLRVESSDAKVNEPESQDSMSLKCDLAPQVGGQSNERFCASYYPFLEPSVNCKFAMGISNLIGHRKFD